MKTLWVSLIMLAGVGLVDCALSADLRSVLSDDHAKGEGASHWIYNDLDAAIAAARAEDKPIFVTFRCVPCAACKSFDAEVAQGSGRIRDLAKAEFIPLRIVEMKGVPLDLFQFDHDLNWAAMFINADKVIYGRYGTQSSDGPDAYNSIDSLEAAMKRVLAIHAEYPLNRDSLEGKGPRPTPYGTALELPGMRNKEKLAKPTEPHNCIHCHMIHDAEHFQAVSENAWSIEKLWRYPHPDIVGLKIEAKDGRRIEKVIPGSAAAKAGVSAGEEILAMNDQPIVSIADMQWVLHHLGNGMETLAVRTSKGQYTLKTESGWKKDTDWAWRGSKWSAPPMLRTWAPPLSADEKKKRGLDEDQLALLVKWINRKERGGRAVYAAGIRQGDVIIGLDGKAVTMDHKEFNVHLKLNYGIGDTIRLKVLRGKEEKEFSLTFVE